ncbi:hypothetical protein FYJ43_10390 [Cutibacterium sp. WCA-380-WT-3A]|uniref:Cellulose synthase n=1 Tax=Cutibacterium porci TaxID=2605781 RepID=A0A7K0J8Z9_9ACTN|nr:hypothetical protein [Cutibacterium porci]MSS46416.1 hypothetical protein [Cutibacterium porci]
MSETTVVAVVTIVLVVLPLLWALSGWLSRRSSRAMLRGLGLAVLPIGLVLTGLMRLLVRAIHLVVDWFTGTAMTRTIWIGVIVIVIGLVTWFVAGFMTPVDRETGRQRRQDHATRKKARDASQAIPASTSTNAPGPHTTRDASETTPASAPVRTSRPVPEKPSAPASDNDEDAELEEILRKRGIE